VATRFPRKILHPRDPGRSIHDQERSTNCCSSITYKNGKTSVSPRSPSGDVLGTNPDLLTGIPGWSPLRYDATTGTGAYNAFS